MGAGAPRSPCGWLVGVCLGALACGPASGPEADVVRIVAPALAAEGTSPARLLDGAGEQAIRIGALEPRRPDRPGRERPVFDVTGETVLGRLLVARAAGVLHYHAASRAAGLPGEFFEPNRLAVLKAGDTTQLALWLEPRGAEAEAAPAGLAAFEIADAARLLALAQALGAWSVVAADRFEKTADGRPRLPFFLPERPGEWRSLSQRSLAAFLPPDLARLVSEAPGLRERGYRALHEFAGRLPELAAAEQRLAADLAEPALAAEVAASSDLLRENAEVYRGYLDSSWIELVVAHRVPDAAHLTVYVHSVGSVQLAALVADLPSKFLIVHGGVLSALTLRAASGGAALSPHLAQDALEFRIATDVAARAHGPLGFEGVRLDYELTGLAGLGGDVWRLLDRLQVRANSGITGEPIPPDHQARNVSLASPRFEVGAAEAAEEFLAAHAGVLTRVGGGASLALDPVSRAFVLPAGAYVLSDDLFLPAGHALVLEAGVELRVQPGRSLLVRGPLEVRGTAERPVRVLGADPGTPWGVLAVQGLGRAGLRRTRVRASIRHLELSGGSEDALKGVFYSGQLSVYHADLELDHATLSGAFADDALNVKHGDVAIRDSRFADNAADGVDLDWATGVVQRSWFGGGGDGGDGLDLSGAKVRIEDCVFSELRDKCVSVGEASSVELRGSLLRGCEAGVASKDRSIATVQRSVFLDNQRNFAAYQKKQIFGGGRIRAEDLLLGEAVEPDTRDALSTLDLEGVGRLSGAAAGSLRSASTFSEARYEALAAEAR